MTFDLYFVLTGFLKGWVSCLKILSFSPFTSIAREQANNIFFSISFLNFLCFFLRWRLLGQETMIADSSFVSTTQHFVAFKRLVCATSRLSLATCHQPNNAAIPAFSIGELQGVWRGGGGCWQRQCRSRIEQVTRLALVLHICLAFTHAPLPQGCVYAQKMFFDRNL